MPDRGAGILLDTSVIIAHLRGKLDLEHLVEPTEALFLPLVVLGELYKGVERSIKPAQNRQLVEEFLQGAFVLLPDLETAAFYARTAADLERKGQVIPENDLWIAAVALQCDLPLATLDAHFHRVAGLSVLRW